LQFAYLLECISLAVYFRVFLVSILLSRAQLPVLLREEKTKCCDSDINKTTRYKNIIKIKLNYYTTNTHGKENETII
jgi:hypothetical protein